MKFLRNLKYYFINPFKIKVTDDKLITIYNRKTNEFYEFSSWKAAYSFDNEKMRKVIKKEFRKQYGLIIISHYSVNYKIENRIMLNLKCDKCKTIHYFILYEMDPFPTKCPLCRRAIKCCG